ncbi:Esterase YqiA [hydrothermal vent metagenome]|uniref:Esterase YqiA n=1 Tax=hydrothermal vent metagenome TaxID=652676 RepID=A0A3B0WNR6_9ZZZZ
MKANMLKAYLEKIHIPDVFVVPSLSFKPKEAMNQLIEMVETYQASNSDSSLCFIGSSLGGYYATWLAEKYESRVVLINPAVNINDLFKRYLGNNHNSYTGEDYCLTMNHVHDLETFNVDTITQVDRYLLMLQTGDEVLNYKHALDKYVGAPSIVEEGGDHGFAEFERHQETILAFCGINCLKKYA